MRIGQVDGEIVHCAVQLRSLVVHVVVDDEHEAPPNVLNLLFKWYIIPTINNDRPLL